MPEELLSDAEFERIRKLDHAAFIQLHPDLRERFEVTRDHHFGERQKLSTEGMMIGGKSMAETLEEIRRGKS